MTTTKVQSACFALTLALALTTVSAVGCDVGTKPVGTDEAGEDETDDGGSMDGGQTTTTGGEEDSGDTTDTGSGDTTAGTDGEAGTEATTETGEEDDWQAICADYCQVATTCLEENMGDLTCEVDCIEELEGLGTEFPPCLPLYVDAYTCFGGLSCEQANTNDGCLEEFASLGDCGDLGCETSLGGPLDQSSCDFSSQCTLGPLYEIVCTGDSCVCTVNETEIGSCANDGAVCGATPFIDVSPINDCCGWELTENG